MITGYQDFYYNVCDIQKASDFYVKAFGGKILGETDQAWGHMLVFEDLDGNILKLMNPKY